MKDICYSYYVLDIVHRGHRLQMRNAKGLVGSDGKSIVGILTKEAVLEKKPQKPILSFDERIGLAQDIRYNDVVIPQKTYSPIENIKYLKPDIVLESESHSKKDIEEVTKIVEEYGGKVMIMPYFPYISSTNIKQKIRKQ